MSKGKYALHLERWAGGCGSDICDGARKVFARGVIPCDVLFVGEAPGESEDVIGRPFVGPAGHLLDHMIKEALPGDRWFCKDCDSDVTNLMGGDKFGGCPNSNCQGFNIRPVGGPRLAYTNLVCCVPRTEEGGKAGPPPDEAIRACQPRLSEFLSMAQPRLVVCVGKLSADFVEEQGSVDAYRHALRLPGGVKRVEVMHPAAILRCSVAQKGLLMQRWVVTVRNAYEDITEAKR